MTELLRAIAQLEHFHNQLLCEAIGRQLRYMANELDQAMLGGAVSIQAIILDVIEDDENLILQLGPYKGEGPGQQELTIMNFTHKPRAGQNIWGGTNSVIIEPNEEVDERRHYLRQGYTFLREDTRSMLAREGAAAVEKAQIEAYNILRDAQIDHKDVFPNAPTDWMEEK